MNKSAYGMLKDSGQKRIFFVMILLRLPFDTLRAMLAANMLEKFLRVADTGTYEDLFRCFIGFLILSILLFAYNMTVWMTISVRTSVNFHNGVKRNVFKALLNLSAEEMAQESVGDRISRLNNDTDTAINYLNAPVNYMHMVIALCNVICSSLFMLFLNPELYILTVLIAGISFTINTGAVTREITEILSKSRDKFAGLTGMLSLMLAGKEAVEIYDAREFLISKTEESSRNIMKQNMKAWQKTAVSSMVMTLSGGLGYLVLLIAGDRMMGKRIEDFAKLTKITQYRANMIMSVGLVNDCIVNMRGNLVGVKKVTEITAQKNSR